MSMDHGVQNLEGLLAFTSQAQGAPNASNVPSDAAKKLNDVTIQTLVSIRAAYLALGIQDPFACVVLALPF